MYHVLIDLLSKYRLNLHAWAGVIVNLLHRLVPPLFGFLLSPAIALIVTVF